MHRDSLKSATRIVVKLGTGVLTDSRKLIDPAQLEQIVAQIAALTQTPDVKQELITNTQRSADRGTFGSPTFFVGEEIYFGKDRLRDVEEAILRTAA